MKLRIILDEHTTLKEVNNLCSILENNFNISKCVFNTYIELHNIKEGKENHYIFSNDLLNVREEIKECILLYDSSSNLRINLEFNDSVTITTLKSTLEELEGLIISKIDIFNYEIINVGINKYNKPNLTLKEKAFSVNKLYEVCNNNNVFKSVTLENKVKENESDKKNPFINIINFFNEQLEKDKNKNKNEIDFKDKEFGYNE